MRAYLVVGDISFWFDVLVEETFASCEEICAYNGILVELDENMFINSMHCIMIYEFDEGNCLIRFSRSIIRVTQYIASGVKVYGTFQIQRFYKGVRV